MAHNGTKNLKPIKTTEEAKAKGKRGGIASGKARRERKTFKEELIVLLETGQTQEKISLALIQEALSGNVKAFETIRDTIGEKPKDNLEVTGSIPVVIEDDINE